jgi:hypothetical protein
MRPKSGKSSAENRLENKTAHSVITLPAAWSWLVDEIIPTWVKKNYSPKESWKDKPFSIEDSRFFFRGIEELSELFTDERPAKLPSYFAHPKFRSAYLLYFLPLQAAKFVSVLQMHRQAFQAALAFGQKTGTLHLADLGAGPGTASIAFLLYLLDEFMQGKQDGEIPLIELHWLDTNKHILEDGRALVEQMSEQFPRLRGKVKVHLHAAPWWEAPRLLPKEMALILLGNVLNEAQLPRSFSQSSVSDSSGNMNHGKSGQLWADLLERAKGGGILLLEPAIRRSSQLLSNLRNGFIDLELIPNSPTSIWGPCLHAGACPLAEGRDWCHFSVPIQIPGKWFAAFSKGLGSERHWVKFAYLWVASLQAPAPQPAANLRRVISDPLNSSAKGNRPGTGREADTVLICEPEMTGKLRVPAAKRVRRGDLVKT